MSEQLKQWIFFAKVLPERASISLRGLEYSVEVHSPDLGFKCRFERIAVIDSQIIARVTFLEGQTDVFTLRNTLASHLRSLADLVGFLTGRHLDVEITSATSVSDPDNWYIFGNTIPVLARDTAELSMDTLQAALADNQLVMALADFRKAMPDGTETGFYCRRAIEAVMQAFALPDDNDGKRWERMRAALNIDRAAIDYIKPHADARRHGKTSPSVTDEQRQKIFKITHAVISRLLAMKIAKASALDVSTYPQIKEDTF